MRSAARVGALALALGATGACERVVDVDIPAPEPRLVVEGRIELVKEAPKTVQTIRLSTTDDFFSNQAPPPATGAVVSVRPGGGAARAFAEVEPGLYVTSDFPAALGETYELVIDYGGDRYRASATLGPVPPIDHLYFVYREESLVGGDEGWRAAIDFQDPTGEENFYLWEQLVNGVREVAPDPGNVFNRVSRDQWYDGQEVTGFQPDDERALASGDRVEVRQISLTRRAYQYYFTVFEQNALGAGNPFSVPPSTVRGNVVNETRPDRFAFGYFEAAEVSVAEGVAPER